MAQVFSFEFCAISKNNSFTEHLLATASFKKMLSDVLILAMWPKWLHNHLQEEAKSEKPHQDLLILLRANILTNFEDDDFNQLHW